VVNDYNRVRQLLLAKKDEAERVAPLIDEDGNETPLKAQLEDLEVSDMTEVDAAIEDAERILKQYQANPEIILHYEKLKDEIEILEAELADFADTREKSIKMLTDLRKDWETRLTEYVTKINTLFTSYMAEMGCTGEVSLTKGAQNESEGSKNNFKDWGLEIRVSFREGCKAEVLSAQRHSGGERSVSTILYLMSLQHLMVAPFRCVDEINQGLDDRNERLVFPRMRWLPLETLITHIILHSYHRLVFSRIVANSCSPPDSSPTEHSGQYFLITPKLLPNLTDMENEAVTVLFVFNGPHNFKSSAEWQIVLEGASAVEVAIEDENSDNNNLRASKKSRLSLD
jgi:structural maintenance of chromosomes protein 5